MSEQRLIDANALLEVLEQRKRLCTGVYGDLGGAISGVIKLIDNAPTVEEVSVIEFKEPLPLVKAQKIVKTLSKRPQGEWIETQRGIHVTDYKCSCCGRTVRDDTGYDVSKDYPFCNCGANMRGGKE